MSDVRIPKNGYMLKVLKSERGVSSQSQNPILVQEFEIVRNARDELNGEVITSRGALIEKALFFVNQQRRALGLKPVTKDEVGDINANEYVGLEGPAVCETEAKEMKNDVDGSVIINPATGKPAVSYNRVITAWLDPK